LFFQVFFSSLIPNQNLIQISDSAERVSNRTDVPPPTAAVKPQYRPVESLAAQLQRQNLAAEGVTGYKQFKNEFQNIDLNDTRSPIPQPSQFKVNKKLFNHAYASFLNRLRQSEKLKFLKKISSKSAERNLHQKRLSSKLVRPLLQLKKSASLSPALVTSMLLVKPSSIPTQLLRRVQLLQSASAATCVSLLLKELLFLILQLQDILKKQLILLRNLPQATVIKNQQFQILSRRR
jgi:hypothetical protein